MITIKCKALLTLMLGICFEAKLSAAVTGYKPVHLKKDSSLYSKNSDPFLAYLTIVPTVIDTISSVQSGVGDEAIITREIVYSSKNNINHIYAVIASPQRPGKFPALLILHGGSGDAKGLTPIVEKYARKGYVAIACDMAGFCNIESTPHSTGTWKVHPAPDEAPRFDIARGLQNSSLVDAEVAGLNAFNLLRVQPNVDANKIGITGYSWGGYSTTFLCGLLGKKVKAAYTYWGCGYYDKGSFWQGIVQKMPADLREKWLTYFDAGRRADKIKAHYFIEAASNDTYFWPDAVSATLQTIPGNKNHVWGPNVNHSLTSTSDKMQEIYFDYYLKDKGNPFATVGISKIEPLTDGSKKISIKLKLPGGISTASVKLYYSEPARNWQSRAWVPIPAIQLNKTSYSVVLPANLVNKKVTFYAYVTDSRDVVTSSDMY